MTNGQNLIPVLIAVVALTAAVLVKQRRHGAAGREGPGRRRMVPAAAARLLGDAGLVAAREFRDRARGRTFRIGTVLVVVAVALAIAIPAHAHSTHRAERVGVVGTAPASVRAGIARAGRGVGVTVDLVDEHSLDAARAALRTGRVGLVVAPGKEILLDRALSSTDTSTTAQLARTASAILGVDRAIRASGLSPTQASRLAGVSPLPVRALRAGADRTAQSTSLVGLPLLFILFVVYNSWLLTGVMEEKSGRIVEVLLATIRPIELLAGKILGIGMVAVLQAGLVVATALGVAEAVGSDVLHGATPLFILSTFVWLLLGYAFYCWVYAAAGSLAERRDQAQSLSLPLTAPITFGYVVALAAQTSGHATLLTHVLAYLPPTAPFAMPALVGLGVVTWWQFTLSAVISLAGTVAVARLAATVYRRAVLRTGAPVRLRDVLSLAGPR